MDQIGTYPVRWPGMTLAARVEEIAKAGFDYLCASGVAQLTSADPLENLPKLAAAYGFELDNVHLTGRETNSIWLEGAQGEDVAARYMGEMEQALDAGVSRGIAHVTWGLSAPPLTPLGIERFGKMVRRAQQLGFTICFENSVSAAHLRAVLDAWPSEAAGFCLDAGHWHAFTPDSDLPWRYAQRIRAVHLQDNDGRRDLHMIPLDGCVPYGRLSGVLRGVKRLTMETAGVVQKEIPGKSEALLREELALLPAWQEGLIRVRDGQIAVYEKTDISLYLARLHKAGVRLAQRMGGNADV